MRNILFPNILFIIVLVLLACNSKEVTTSENIVAVPTNTPSPVISTATHPPTPTKIFTPSPTLSPTPTIVATNTPGLPTDDTLKSLLEAEFSKTKFHIQSLDTEEPLWVVYSHGYISEIPLDSHLVTIYTQDGHVWRELDRIFLGEEPETLVDVSQISIEPNNLWLSINGGWGTYSDCNLLVRFDGQKLYKDMSYCNRYDAGNFEDLNGDGVQEVIQDHTNHIVYCGACGVKFTDFKVLRWDGHQFTEEGLKFLDSSSSEIQQLNNQAVELAQAELWQDAQIIIKEALSVDNQDKTVAWNASVINLQTDAKRDEADRHKEYELLLPTLFLGDYDSILGVMQKYSIEELFESPDELTTITEFDDGRQKQATIDWVIKITNSTIDKQPEFAPAYFLRGWAKYLNDSDGLDAATDLQRATQLVPTVSLFSDSYEYLLQSQ